MNEIKMLQEIWKKLKRILPGDQGFTLLLLTAFSWHYGERKDWIALVGDRDRMISRDFFLESIRSVQDADVQKAFYRLSEQIDWQRTEQETAQRFLREMTDYLRQNLLAGGRPRDVFAALLDLMGRSGKYAVTPAGIRDLILELLGVRRASRLAAVWCGGAGVGAELWTRLRSDNPELLFHGEERNRELCDVAKINGYVYGISEGEIAERDLLKQPEKTERQRYDMIVMDVPRGQNLIEIYEKTDPRFSDCRAKKVYADWFFIQDALYRLDQKGIAAVIVTPAALIRRNEKELRRQIVMKDWLEAVITLPDHLYPNDPTGRELLILNKAKERKGQTVFIDISPYFEKEERRIQFLSEEGIRVAKNIFDAPRQIYEISAVCRTEEIIEKECSFKPLQYIRRKGEDGDRSGIALGNVAEIVRGSQQFKKEDIVERVRSTISMSEISRMVG